jgi:acetyl esterase/lipase
MAWARDLWFTALACALLVACATAQTSNDNARLREYLQQHPEADANKDGVLTMQEAQAHRRQTQQGQARPQPQRPQPTHADVAYGDHPKLRFDLWLPESAEPTPLVLFIHGGGFSGGDKQAVDLGMLNQCLANGIAYASLNYRLTPEITAPQPYLDCARALQTIRSRAKEWNLDATRVVSTGGSAGAGISLWLAFHDDLADPNAEDPIAKESTRLLAVATNNGQCSYDPFWCESIGLPRLTQHGFFHPFYGIQRGQENTDEAKAKYAEAAPITYLTEDDPPVLMLYNRAPVEITAETDMGTIVHHPKFGLALQERMTALGLRCLVQWPGREEDAEPKTFGFLKGYLKPEA